MAGLLAALALAGCSGGSRAELPAAVGVLPAAAAGGPATAQTGAPRSFSLVATGDVLLHEPLWQQAREDSPSADGSPDFTAQLDGIRASVASADVAICHLETPLAPPEGPYRGYPGFSAPPQVVSALADVGYDACTTASNHSFDQGAAGITRTLGALDAAGLAHAGTARTAAEADRTTILDVGSTDAPVRVALLSYTFGFNGVPVPGGELWRANAIDEATVLRDAAAARREGADVTVVVMHWGDEYEQVPSAAQLALAPRLLASPDIDLLLGHHTHVVQPVEQVDGEWVVYGMGNLLAAHSTPGEPLREGLLARFAFTEQPDGRFLATRAGFAPLLVTDRPPYRVLDVAQALRDGGTANAPPQRLATAWARTTGVVNSRGAGSAGLSPLSSP